MPLAKDETLDLILTELGQKLEPGGEVALNAAALAALETTELGATTLAALETIELGATTLAALESITVGTALPAGTNNIGDVDVLTEPATAADNAAGLPAVVKVVGGYDGTNVQALKTDSAGKLETTATVAEGATAADGAAGLPAVVKVVAGYDGTNVQALAVDPSGNAQVEVINTPTVAVAGTADVDVNSMPTGQGKTLKFAPVNIASSGDTTIVAAVTGMKIKLVSYVLVADAAVDVYWRSGTGGTALSGPMGYGPNGGAAPIGQPSSHLLETLAVNTALVLNLSAAVQVSGHISYFEEA